MIRYCIVSDLQSVDGNWYSIITSQLTPEQTKQLEDVFKLAEQRKAAAGIYSFCYLKYLKELSEIKVSDF